jgi:hypothetical protein
LIRARLMATPHVGTRNRAPLSPVVLALLVCALFAVSGMAGLVYEVAWKHIFTTVFGNTTYAVSVVIAVFMGGLGIGNAVLGKRADRARSPLAWYALLELSIALAAALGLAARRHAMERFGWESHVVDGYDALYRRLGRQDPAPPQAHGQGPP